LKSRSLPLLLLEFGLLSRIFEIIRPVKVYSVGSPLVPLFWSFGAYQAPSSEGFLVSFTPGGDRRNLFFSFCFLSEYPRKVHFSNQRNEPSAHSEPPTGEKPCTNRKLTNAIAVTRTPSRSHRADWTTRSDSRLNQTRVLGEAGGIDLMIPCPRPGILGALNPTDESRPGNDRNTLNKSTRGTCSFTLWKGLLFL